jgi:excisionase family DNA binding protein
MTVKEAAARLGVSVSTIYGLTGAGKLRCSRVGLGRGVIRISEEQLSQYLHSAEPGPAMPPPAPRLRLKHLRLS